MSRPNSRYITGTDDEPEAAAQPLDAEEFERADALTPLPSRPTTAVGETQNEVSESPAFQTLDNLFQEGKLTGTKVSHLKWKYTDLHELLKKTRAHEIDLLQEAKEAHVEMERQKQELANADNFPENVNTETSRLRELLLKHNNDLAETEDRLYTMQYKLSNLREEKDIMQREYDRLPKQEDLEKRLKTLQTDNEEFRREIGQRQSECKALKEDLDQMQRQQVVEKKELEVEVDKYDALKNEFIEKQAVPADINREVDRIVKQKLEADKEHNEICRKYESQVMDLARLEKLRKELEDQKHQAEKELDRQRNKVDETEREMELWTKEFEYLKDKEAVYMGDKATLDLNMKHLNQERRSLHDMATRRAHEKDKTVRDLKKAEIQLRTTKDQLTVIADTFQKVKHKKDDLPGLDAYKKEKDKLSREEVSTKKALEAQDNLTAVEQARVEQNMKEEEKLLFEKNDLHVEVIELTRLAAIKADEREQKARAFISAETRHKKSLEDLKVKDIAISDHEKKLQQLQSRLKEFSELYTVIKNERNKCVNLIQVATQKVAEMREKLKILQNETEILRTTVVMKDRQLQKQKLRHVNEIVQRDSVRNEVSKATRILVNQKSEIEQQKLNINKLSNMINQAEEEMVQFRKKYESAVQHRNDRGVQLIERNEEVCVFYEKLNIQDTLLRNGQMELTNREEEVRFLKVQSGEEMRQIELLRKRAPRSRRMQDEMVTAQIQLTICQDRLLELSRQVENPQSLNHCRVLEGPTPTLVQLKEKSEKLEWQLSQKEEQAGEKALILQQVERQVDRLYENMQLGGGDSLELAKKVNDYQTRIKDTTNKMMAIVAELSMKQAMSFKMEQEIKEKEYVLEDCYRRMEAGDAPSMQWEVDFEKNVHSEERRKREKLVAQASEADMQQFLLQGGGITTAEPRPNAYLPDTDHELPIPRPYGGAAPFKPQQAGATMRHMRKPVPKPIEI